MIDLTKYINDELVFKTVRQVAQENNVRAYLIGGFVRDILLNRESKDIDFVIDGDSIVFAEKVIEKLDSKIKLSVFKNFRTAHFNYQGSIYEFVGARKESYIKNSRNPQVEVATIKEDQERRDFTVNAMSISLNNDDYGMLIDPFNGQEDLKNKILRTPLDSKTTFNDDPLRMLRAIRFATQLNFSIDNDCLASIKFLSHRVKIVAVERVVDEINKILLTQKPSKGFYLMEKTGLLNYILPELTFLKGVEPIGKFKHKDIFIHTLEVLDNVSEFSDNIWLKWAALLHDIGKPLTKNFFPNQGWTFHGHEVVGVKIAHKIFNRLRLPQNEKLDFVKKLIGLHLRPIALVEKEVTDSAIRRLLFDAGDDIDDLMLLCRADITSKNMSKVHKYQDNFDKVTQKLLQVEENDKLRNWQPPISGEKIMEAFGLTPCREVGTIKTAIREAILDGKIPNNYDDAYSFMLDFAKKININPIKN